MRSWKMPPHPVASSRSPSGVVYSRTAIPITSNRAPNSRSPVPRKARAGGRSPKYSLIHLVELVIQATRPSRTPGSARGCPWSSPPPPERSGCCRARSAPPPPRSPEDARPSSPRRPARYSVSPARTESLNRFAVRPGRLMARTSSERLRLRPRPPGPGRRGHDQPHAEPDHESPAPSSHLDLHSADVTSHRPRLPPVHRQALPRRS